MFAARSALVFAACLLLITLTATAVAGQAGLSADRELEIILDASGSMNGKPAVGQRRIDAAKSAVERWLEGIPDSTEIAFRAYGHQAPREQQDCQDTELLVDFGSIEDQKAAVLDASRGLVAQGYTPISYALEQAAGDFSKTPTTGHSIILVSDGKETCEGDPCAVAQALAEADAELVIHTVGFGVDDATRGQLECIARMGRGAYFSASDADSLAVVLAEAVETASVENEADEGQGWLEVKGADLSGHRVTDAVTGEHVGEISSVQSTIGVPAGIYNVSVGEAVWKSVEVRDGETTVLEPAWLTVHNAALAGHPVTEAETGVEHAEPSSLHNSVALMPGDYDVWFGSLPWRVRLDVGQRVVLEPGTVQVRGADFRGHLIQTADGVEVGSVSNTMNWLPLPPGEYRIELDGEVEAISLEAGEDLVFER